MRLSNLVVRNSGPTQLRNVNEPKSIHENSMEKTKRKNNPHASTK